MSVPSVKRKMSDAAINSVVGVSTFYLIVPFFLCILLFRFGTFLACRRIHLMHYSFNKAYKLLHKTFNRRTKIVYTLGVSQ